MAPTYTVTGELGGVTIGCADFMPFKSKAKQKTNNQLSMF